MGWETIPTLHCLVRLEETVNMTKSPRYLCFWIYCIYLYSVKSILSVVSSFHFQGGLIDIFHCILLICEAAPPRADNESLEFFTPSWLCQNHSQSDDSCWHIQTNFWFVHSVLGVIRPIFVYTRVPFTTVCEPDRYNKKSTAVQAAVHI